MLNHVVLEGILIDTETADDGGPLCFGALQYQTKGGIGSIMVTAASIQAYQITAGFEDGDIVHVEGTLSFMDDLEVPYIRATTIKYMGTTRKEEEEPDEEQYSPGPRI